MEKEYLTKEKIKELALELENLKTVKRQEIAEALEYAKSLGDLKENSEYHQAREDQANTEERIQKLETILANAEVLKVKHTDTVQLGSIVVIKKKGEKDKKEYQIVGSEEADSLAGKISKESPLGQAMLGKKKKEIFDFETPAGKMHYEIVDIK